MEKNCSITAIRAASTALDGAPSESEAVAEGLLRLLILTRALCGQSLSSHWHAMGPEFAGLHSMFEQHYQSSRKAMDIIASRIDALGHEIPKSPAKATRRNEANPPHEMLNSLIKDHLACAREAKKVMVTADSAGDEVSANIAAQRLSVHEKAAWLLATLTESKSAIRSLM